MNLEELAAREAIRDLVARYNHAGDRGLLDELVACFAEDGAMEIEGEPRLEGRGAIHAHLSGVARRLAASTRRATLRHHVSSVRIVVHDAAHAEAWSYFSAFTEIGLDHWGRYSDRLVRSGSEWLFALRKVRVDGAAPGSRMVASSPP
ncbi:MAG TPA: nuclear transport factor 2 family protein [Myxococcota bacterium]|nr:nuclear transport factor 2 family protein [Myxococcota bacterium]